jgi:hypothetical protein
MEKESKDSGFRFLYWDDICHHSINNNKEEENADSKS